MLENVEIIDPQGQTYPAAVVRVNAATQDQSENSSSTRNFHRNASDNQADGEVNESNYSSSNNAVRCSYAYWPSVNEYNQGLVPYILVNGESGNGNEFYIPKETLDSVEYSGLSLEQICETYFTNEVLPTLKGATE